MWQEVAEVLGSIPGGTTFLSFPLLFQESLDSNGSDYLWLDDLHQSLDCGGRSPIHQTPHAVIMLTILSWSKSIHVKLTYIVTQDGFKYKIEW